MKLTRNIVWNTAGITVPLLVGVAAVPPIVKGLGTERFGFLSIIWVMIGYFSIFDLGLGRTLTKLAADRLADGREKEIPAVASTALTLVAASSVLVSVVIALAAGWLARHALGASAALLPEATVAILFLCASLPFVLLATVLTGLLEAYQEFALINAVRLPVGILILVSPLAVLPFSHHLGLITAVLAGVRIVNAGILARLAVKIVPGLAGEMLSFRRELVRPLLTFGGWLTVSNIVGPVMVYFDRFVIAAVLGSAAIAYYTVPYDVLNRMLVIPTAIQGVLFPAFAMLRAQNSPRLLSVFERSSAATMLLMTPALIAVMLFAQEGLKLWVGEDFARHSAETAKVLMVGVMINAMARTPFGFVQGAGYAKWTALLHSFELPFYGISLWLLLRSGTGIEGAAYAWTGRIAVDTIALYAMAVKLEGGLLRPALRHLGSLAAACLLAVSMDWMLGNSMLRLTALLLAGLACLIALMNQRTDARAELLKRNT
jgi:O-antigen/teichoic acid export membrane protein